MPAAVRTCRLPARPALWLWTLALVAGCCLARPNNGSQPAEPDPPRLNGSPVEEADPLDVPIWTINTVHNLYDGDIWRKYKIRHGVGVYLTRYNMEQNESLVERVWVARVEMLKYKFQCFDRSEPPYGIDVTTFLPIRDACDDDPYMCANKPRDLGRRLFDAFLKTANKKIMGHGNDGFNEYTLMKTIYLLKLQSREYVRCKPKKAKEAKDEVDLDFDALYTRELPKKQGYSAESEPAKFRYEFMLRPYKSPLAQSGASN